MPTDDAPEIPDDFPPLFPPTNARKPGRPRKADATTLETKVRAGRMLLLDGAPAADVARALGRGRGAVYEWARAACDSDHPLAPALRAAAIARGLWRPAGGEAAADARVGSAGA